MFYQLPGGRVIEITTDQYFELTDEEIEYLVAYNYGEYQENPFFGSAITNGKKSDEEVVESIDMTDITEIEKLIDLDVDFDLEIE